ncbi:hypothetical protein AB0F59_33175 [Micromonospora lupini]|uniref:hypothetical protein n=1 Tax=Micromonospora lupini TaxID=285679 RepID=UPI0033F27F3E
MMLFEDLLLADEDRVIDAIAVVVLSGADALAAAEEFSRPGGRRGSAALFRESFVQTECSAVSRSRRR